MLADVDWISLLERNGLATFLVIAAVVGTWRVGLFLAPQVRDLLSSQLMLVQNLDKSIPIQTEALNRQGEVLRQHGEILTQHGEILRQHGDILLEVHTLVKEVNSEEHS